MSKKYLFLLIIVLMTFCSKSGGDNVLENYIENHSQKFITSDILESMGFEHFDVSNFFMLFNEDNLYIMNMEDLLIAKLRGVKPGKVFKTAKGQAPRELIVPRSLFLYNADTLSVYDIGKSSILFFDFDLNYLDERPIGRDFIEIQRSQDMLLSCRMFQHDTVFASLDDEFNVVETFVNADKKIPVEGFPPPLVNFGIILNNGLVAHTYRWYPFKNCRINIYDTCARQSKVVLSWEQPFSPTEQDIKSRRNLYFSFYVGNHCKYYVVQNSISKKLKGNVKYDLLIFNDKGKLLHQSEFPYRLIRFRKDIEDTMLYFLDDDEDISCADLRKIIDE
jgi:hypothetical protein